MSDGKLKKLLIQELNKITLTATFKPNTPDWQTQTCPVTIQGLSGEMLQKILDEAKKEFPDPEAHKYGGFMGLPWNYSMFNRDLFDWFQKWFGEAK